jgi:hypothetical protein
VAATARVLRAWVVWGVVSVGMVGYAALAHIAAHTVVTKVQLKPGNSVEVELFRVSGDTLWFRLFFRTKGVVQRPELGSWAYIEKDGFLELRPGANVRIVASVPDSPPVEYEAMPLSGFGRDFNERRMTANLSVRPGVYRWPPPPSTPSVHLHAGFNTVRFEVTSVDEPIVDETVDLDVPSPLGFKSSETSVAWLWFGLMWPVLVCVQVIWAACLVVYGLQYRKSVS